MHKFLLAALVGATALTGCDFSESEAPSAAVSVSSIEVSDLGRRAWDDDSGPDVFVEIRNPAGRAFYRSAVQADADITETLVFEVDEAVFASSPTMPLVVAVFDLDNDLVNSDIMSETTSFTAEELAAGDVTPEANRGASVIVRSSAGL